MEEFEGRRRRMLATEECCTMCKWVDWGLDSQNSHCLGSESFENGGRVLCRHPSRRYTGGRRSPTP